MREYFLNQTNNFIEGYYIENLSICDRLIRLFEDSNKKITGRVGTGDIVKEIKESTDLNLFAEDIQKYSVVSDYLKQLNKSLTLYKQKYKYCDEKIGTWGLENHFNIQKYKPGQAFHGIHCERASI